MKQFLLTSIFALAAVCAINAEQKQALRLHGTDGAKIVYFLDNQPTVTFAGQELTVTDATSQRTFPLEGIERWTFGIEDTDGVADPTVSLQPRILVFSDGITVENPSGAAITVYTLAGTMAGSSNATVAEFRLTSGIYVVTVGNRSYKIAL